MSPRYKNFIKALLRRSRWDALFRILVRRALEQIMVEQPEFAERLLKDRLDARNARLRSRLVNAGDGVILDGDVYISDPRGLVLGNNVYLGHDSRLLTRGGISIGDGTHVASQVTIYSAHHDPALTRSGRAFRQIDMPVIIGREVWIGTRAVIAPGVTIGDYATIGPGTVVTANVAPGTTATGDTAEPVTSDASARLHHATRTPARENATDKGAQLFFVLGTGRSGSTTVARALSRHPEVTCLHEPKLELVRLSTELAHGIKTSDEVKTELTRLYVEPRVLPLGCYGESDQKLSNLIPLLAELFPHAKFVWLLRNARDTVSSMYSRGWFSDVEMYPEQTADLGSETLLRGIYSQYRVRPDRTGQLDAAQWRNMSAFARNCWYWNDWNARIERDLRTLPDDRRHFVRLEELDQRIDDLFKFLGVRPLGRQVVQTENVAERRYTLISHSDWSRDQIDAYECHCASNATRWYDADYRL